MEKLLVFTSLAYLSHVVEWSLNGKNKFFYMQKTLLFIGVIVSMGFSFCISGCGGNREHEGEYEFDYYPDKNIYYSIESSKFIYSLDGGKKWDNIKANINEDAIILGKKEKIYSKTPEVWKENETHLKMYEGKPYMLISDEDKKYASAVDEVSDKRTVTKKGTSNKRTKQPKKKGVRDFINKVLGRKG